MIITIYYFIFIQLPEALQTVRSKTEKFQSRLPHTVVKTSSREHEGNLKLDCNISRKANTNKQDKNILPSSFTSQFNLTHRTKPLVPMFFTRTLPLLVVSFSQELLSGQRYIYFYIINKKFWVFDKGSKMFLYCSSC